jgi:hypothetical protein
VKRFITTFGLVVGSLFVVVSGVNTALDHLAHSGSENSFTVYNEKGSVLLAYEGNLNFCKAFTKPYFIAAPTFLHRT